MTGGLAELPEAEATGRAAEIYADIRAVLGLPVVNLVYRHLATRPGLLEASWAAIRPNLASEAGAAASAELAGRVASPAVAPIPRASLAAVRLVGEEAELTRATVAAYRRANSRNLLGMQALLDGCAGYGDGGAEAPAPPAEPILPMASLEELPLHVAFLLDEMSLRAIGGAEPRIVPSLLRHFAADVCLLALLWAALRPAVDEVPPRATAVAEQASALAAGLPYSVAPVSDEPVRSLVARFAEAMARMLVLGEMLAAALAEAE